MEYKVNMKASTMKKEESSLDRTLTMRTLVATLFEILVDAMATLIAAILSHPKVEAAATNVMVAGMNAFLEQPNLGDHAKVMESMVNEKKEDTARSIGRDVPMLVGGFLGGLMENIRNNNGNNDKKVGKDHGSVNFIEEEKKEDDEGGNETNEQLESKKDA